ncbi:hypothetical protein HZY62_08740 [Maribacter polysiphoniae]|jgi:hypothetical protein|uniref:Lipocalin-like protein n=2 Tax=Flavobacteriaceae TaxID=49546 RepID=A0A316E493_9FLAO|nr:MULTISPECIES: hypothetical protein [Flavobacteriaceae]MBD1260672.1 hypothetical protein [Maribacter polysiphoniae]PWK24199.1 hypothetical protein LX92_01786 [Maribacter polysiphoniae]RPG36707.1 MAG: hypothetical protein CBB72_003630 [Muricauda sp. TMED12]RYC51672.1 hypothetical protein DN53_12625 [Allomuricauda olearia]|tara:strand:- start:70990 stop:71475 length:486 start_codon:yes stop_codon:yes gene_type:complete
MKPNIFIILAFPMMLFFSCNSDDDSVTESDRSQALLGQWEYESIDSNTAVDINGDGTVNVDLFNTNEIRQCLKDNLTFFSSRGAEEKGAFSINENGLSCGEVPAFQNVEDDSYELIDNRIIRFDNRNDWIIVEFSQNRLVVDQEDFLDDQDVVITYSFKRS